MNDRIKLDDLSPVRRHLVEIELRKLHGKEPEVGLYTATAKRIELILKPDMDWLDDMTLESFQSEA